MSEFTTKNAVIKKVRFCLERGFTIIVDLDYGSAGQGFGGYALYNESDTKNYCGLFIKRLFDITGVDDLSRMKGVAVRVKSSLSEVRAIGHVVNDDWFCPKDELK